MSRSKITSSSIDSTVGNSILTKSSSDPAINTNGSLGDIWVNITTGQMYILKDATTNANVWANVGKGSADIDFPDASGITIDSAISVAIDSTSQTYTFSNGSDDVDTTFDWAIENIADTDILASATASGDVTDVSSAGFTFTMGSTEGSTTFDVAITDSQGYKSTKQFTATAAPAGNDALSFSSNSPWTLSNYTGQDGTTRTNAQTSSPQHNYSGATFASAFDNSYGHTLIIRCQGGDAYFGAGVSYAPTITDSQAANYPFSEYYGEGGDWTGASGVRNDDTYFNQSGDKPENFRSDFYIYFYTTGSAGSRNLHIRFSTSYSEDYNTYSGYDYVYDSSSPNAGISSGNQPIPLGSEDFALAIGEASNLTSFKIEYYVRS